MGCSQVNLKKKISDNQYKIEQLSVQQNIIQLQLEMLQNIKPSLEKDPHYLLHGKKVDSILVLHDSFDQRINKMEEKLRILFKKSSLNLPNDLMVRDESQLNQGQILDLKGEEEEEYKPKKNNKQSQILKIKRSYAINPYFLYESKCNERKKLKKKLAS